MQLKEQVKAYDGHKQKQKNIKMQKMVRTCTLASGEKPSMSSTLLIMTITQFLSTCCSSYYEKELLHVPTPDGQ